MTEAGRLSLLADAAVYGLAVLLHLPLLVAAQHLGAGAGAVPRETSIRLVSMPPPGKRTLPSPAVAVETSVADTAVRLPGRTATPDMLTAVPTPAPVPGAHAETIAVQRPAVIPSEPVSAPLRPASPDEMRPAPIAADPGEAAARPPARTLGAADGAGRETLSPVAPQSPLATPPPRADIIETPSPSTQALAPIAVPADRLTPGAAGPIEGTAARRPSPEAARTPPAPASAPASASASDIAPAAPALAAAPPVSLAARTADPPSAIPDRAPSPIVPSVATTAPSPQALRPLGEPVPANRAASPAADASRLAAIAPAENTAPGLSASSAGRAVQDYLRGYEGSGCFVAVAAQIAEETFAVSGFSRTEGEWAEVNRALDARTGYRFAGASRQVSEPQCPALSFARAQPSYPAFASRISLVSDRLRSGAEIEGRLSGATAAHLALLLVDDEGRVQDVSALLRETGDPATRTFRTPLTLTSGPVETVQLFVALSGPAPLPAVPADGSLKAQDYFPALAEALRGQAAGLDVAFAAFSVE